jgi:hypothetical protein
MDRINTEQQCSFMRFDQKILTTALSICLAMLSACGGGGGGGGSSTSSTTTVTDTGNIDNRNFGIQGGGNGIPTTEASRNLPVNFAVDVSDLGFAASRASAGTPPAQQVLAFFENYSGKLVGEVFLQLTLSGPAVGESSSVATKITIAANGNVASGSETIQDISLGGLRNTFASGALVLRTDGAGILSVGSRIPIRPVAPATLGAGRFMGTATLRACVGDSTCATGEVAGSPRTINISYVIDPVANAMVSVPADTVMPRVQAANVAADAVIRGASLGAVSSMRVGNVAATDVTVLSDTEVRARMPALPAGTYSVTLNNGTVPFRGAVQMVQPISSTARVLSYPGITPERVTAMVYDDVHQSLLIALSGASPADNKVVRYTRTAKGEWQSTAFAVPNLNDLVLTNDGSRLLAVTDTAVQELALDTLAPLRTVPAPGNMSLGVRLQRLALGNDGQAIITTTGGPFLSPALLYSVANGSFATLNNAGQLQANDDAAALVATANGAHIFATQSVAGAAVLDYDSADSVVSERALTIRHSANQSVAVDQNATRSIAFNELPNSATIRDGKFAVLARLGSEDLPAFYTRAAAVNRNGTRAVVLEGSGKFYFFDLTAPAIKGVARQSRTPLSLDFISATSNGTRTAMTADGQVAFFANTSGVAIVPMAE